VRGPSRAPLTGAASPGLSYLLDQPLERRRRSACSSSIPVPDNGSWCRTTWSFPWPDGWRSPRASVKYCGSCERRGSNPEAAGTHPSGREGLPVAESYQANRPTVTKVQAASRCIAVFAAPIAADFQKLGSGSSPRQNDSRAALSSRLRPMRGNPVCVRRHGPLL